MTFDAWAGDAAALSRAYRAGLIRPEPVLARLLAEIALRDGAVGAFVDLAIAEASLAAKASGARFRDGAPLGALDGIPIAVKSNIAVAGLPCAAGIGAWRDRVAGGDAEVVARLRAAGAIIIGTTNMHEGALGATTDNAAFGRCENPAAPGFTPGGSSGGSAAAVAAGFVPIALGTDTMGSVRIPAAYCGVLGLKPTADLMPREGVVALSRTLDAVGVLARSADDIATVMSVLAPGSPSRPRALTPLRAGLPGVPRIAPEPEIAAALASACRVLAGHGVGLTEVTIEGWDPVELRRAAFLLCEAEGAEAHPDLLDARDGVSAGFRALLLFGRDVAPARVADSRAAIARAAGALRDAMADCDVLLMPTTARRAFRHGATPPANLADLTVVANAAGLPAVSVPVSAQDGGRPCAIQLIGHPHGEITILGLADLLRTLYPGMSV